MYLVNGFGQIFEYTQQMANNFRVMMAGRFVGLLRVFAGGVQVIGDGRHRKFLAGKWRAIRGRSRAVAVRGAEAHQQRG